MLYPILQQQYQLVLSSRGALFTYCEGIPTAQLQITLPAFNNESMATQLLHTANCYLFWLANSTMQRNRPFFDIESCKDLNTIRTCYQQVDGMVDEFLNHFKPSLDEKMLITRPDGSQIYRSPFEVFTHVITHEFHHKGQIVNMGRQLGYTPVDTDVIRE